MEYGLTDIQVDPMMASTQLLVLDVFIAAACLPLGARTMTCTAEDQAGFSKGRPRSWAALQIPVMSSEERLGALQEYYANTGALKNAAETAQGGKKVGCSIVETFSKSTKPRELEEVLRLEYRSKLLNPKWAQVRVAGVFFEAS